MLSGSNLRRALALLTVAALTALGSGPASAARADDDLTGYAFDACSAPTQAQMDAWWESSPYAAVGVYIGGSNRLCAQPELDAAWDKKQRRTGWLVLPIQVGPQAACSGYPDRMSSNTTIAEQQGRAEAGKAIGNASALGIKKGSTLYYDLEDFDTGPDDCRQPALAFLSGWSKALRAQGYRSGVYSSIRAAIEKLDYAHQVSTGSYAMPDVIWFAWENGRADTADGGYVDTDLWDDHARIHQYDLDVEATHGGVTLDIDRNWVDVGRGSVGSPSKPLCKQRGKAVTVDLKAYPKRTKGSRGPAVAAAQCLLRRHGWTKAPITGKYDAKTVVAVKKAQKKLDLTRTGKLDRRTWVALLARGSSPLVKVGSTGDAVRRAQRALTAALGKRVRIDGAYSKKTAKAVAKYQRKAGLPVTGVADGRVWAGLLDGTL